MKKTYGIYLILIGYFALLLGFAPINLLSFDTYYYWEWSRHLSLSYYDGSPMIAYFIKLSTLLFGDTLFALSLVGIIVTAITSAIIYKTARFFLTKEASWVAALAWLFSPLITMDLLTQTTYDTPLMLFWALTLYYTVKFIQTNKVKELYFIGISAGLMMLSKYTGVVLILALLIFLISSSYRSIFKTKHFYFAMLLAIFVFSPVLIWNYQHQWQSFIYQLTTHQLNETTNPFYNSLSTFFKMFIPALNFMFLPPFLVSRIKLGKKNELCIRLCRIICITVLCFYLYAASKAELRVFWLAPYLISSALLLGYCFEIFPYRKPIIALIALYALISVCVFIDNSSKYHFVISKRLINYQLMQQFNADYPQLPETILSPGWFEARMLFFLKDKPAVYTIDCGSAQNQYALWSTDIQQKISNKSLKEALYIDNYDRGSCLNKYFDRCERMPTSIYSHKQQKHSLYVYKCMNH